MILSVIFFIVGMALIISIKEDWSFLESGQKITRIVILAIVIILFIVCFSNYLSDEVSSGGSSYSSSSGSSSKNGFVGSDGEYHAYVPEFGYDVNNWMEENW